MNLPGCNLRIPGATTESVSAFGDDIFVQLGKLNFEPGAEVLQRRFPRSNRANPSGPSRCARQPMGMGAGLLA